MNDPTEAIRRQRLAEINAEPGIREALESQHGQVWDTQELRRDFQVLGFAAPLVVVRRNVGWRARITGVSTPATVLLQASSRSNWLSRSRHRSLKVSWLWRASR